MVGTRTGIIVAATALAISVWPYQRAFSEALPPTAHPFLALGNAAPMELARLIDRLGDSAVSEGLEARSPIEVQLIALRAAPWMKAPESALPRVTDLVSSRDSELAPEAARAALRIANGLDRDELQFREVDLSEIARLGQKLSTAGDNALLREDIRLYAAQAAELLRGRSQL